MNYFKFYNLFSYFLAVNLRRKFQNWLNIFSSSDTWENCMTCNYFLCVIIASLVPLQKLKGVESTNNYIFLENQRMSWKTKHICVFTLYSIIVFRLWHAFIIDVLFSVTVGVNTRHIVTVNMELWFSEIKLWSCRKCINTQTGNQKQLITPAGFSVFKQKKISATASVLS